MRGRLICPFIAEIARVDTNATRAASGYDDDFKTVKHTGQGDDRLSSVKYLPAIKLKCQIETGMWETQRQQPTGNIPDSDMGIVIHFRELEQKGLVHAATGDALIRVNDKLISIRDSKTGQLIQEVRDPPGLYAVEVKPIGFGIGRKRNLLLISFADRPPGVIT